MSSCLKVWLFAFVVTAAVRAEGDSTAKEDPEAEEFLNRMQINMGMCFDEIFATACRARILGDSNETDKTRQQIAIASTNLWSKLSTMETVQYVFRKSVLSALSNSMENLSKTNIPSIVEDVFKIIERTMLDDAELAALYRNEKLIVEKLSLSSLDESKSTSSTLYEGNTCFREFIVRMPILWHAFGPHTAFQSLSLATLELAKTAEGHHVQQIFDAAVKITAGKIDLDDMNVDKLTFVSGIAEILFSTLVDLIEETPHVENLFHEHGVRDIRVTPARISLAKQPH